MVGEGQGRQRRGFEDANPKSGRPIQPSRQTDGPGRQRLGPRLEVSLLLHPGERDIDRPTLELTSRLLDQLEPKFLATGEKLENESLSGGQTLKARFHSVIIDLTLCKSSQETRPGVRHGVRHRV